MKYIILCWVLATVSAGYVDGKMMVKVKKIYISQVPRTEVALQSIDARCKQIKIIIIERSIGNKSTNTKNYYRSIYASIEKNLEEKVYEPLLQVFLLKKGARLVAGNYRDE